MRKKLREISLRLASLLLAAVLAFPAVSAGKEGIKNDSGNFFQKCYSGVSNFVKSHKKASVVTVAVIGVLDIICLIPAVNVEILLKRAKKDDHTQALKHGFCWMFFHPYSAWKGYRAIESTLLPDSAERSYNELIEELNSIF